MLKFNALILILLATGACVKSNLPVSKDVTCNGPFIVDRVDGSLSTSDETVLPEKFTLQLKACMRSRGKIETKLPKTLWAVSNSPDELNAYKPTAVNSEEKIKVTDLDSANKVIQLETDGEGCIQWTETYDYAYVKKSQWIVIDRYFKGLSNENAGTCQVPVAVNPWLQLKEQYSNIQVADYRDHYHKGNKNLENRVTAGDGLVFLKQKRTEEKKRKVDILIDELDLHVGGTDSRDNKRILAGNTIKAKLNYTIKDAHGRLRYNQISQGNFRIEPHLLTSMKVVDSPAQEGSLKEKYLRLNIQGKQWIAEQIKTRFENDTFTSFAFDWHIPFENYNSKILLYLKVTPVGKTAKRVNPFEGIYYIGEKFQTIVSGNRQNLKLNSVLVEKYRERIQLDESKNISSKTKTYSSPNECLKDLSPFGSVENCISESSDLRFSKGFGSAGWTIGEINLRFFQVKKENWLSREISTIVKTHIYDPLQNKEIGHQPVKVTVIDLTTGEKNEFEKTTESNGYISFNIPTRQYWYKRQRYFLKIIRFQTKTRELDVQKMIAINPWDYGFTHGHEVNQVDNIRTTCLEDTDKKLVSQLMKEEQLETIPEDKKVETIRKIFCSDSISNDSSSKQLKKWSGVLGEFKQTLYNVLRKTKKSFNIDNDFHRKFESSANVKNPTAQIHLFRSINKYPTYLIDDSLIRDVYYNIRFKLSPRIVRHDDIARGVQNKGPIRDGIYIFQMAVLKNEQEKFDGDNVMAQPKRDFSQHISGIKRAGTVPLFSCPKENPKCVTKSDFIIPPTNIPIVIRDGIIKTDIRTRIKREHLLFSNSKNILVFRLLPADPNTVVCKNQDSDCTLENFNDYDSYEAAFDWDKTIEKVQPAKLDSQYNMFFYTYKTPFIPNLWTNWNITHETDMNFSDLSQVFAELSELEENNLNKTTAETFKEEEEGLNLVLGQSLSENNISPEGQSSLSQQISQAKNNENLFSSRVDESKLKNTKQEPVVQLPQTSEVVIPESLKGSVEQDTNYCSGVEIDSKFYSTSDDEEQCPTAPVQKTDIDTQQEEPLKKETKLASQELIARHVEQFASSNTLCTIDINSKESSIKRCGYFDGTEKAQKSFVDNLNTQIQVINTSKDKISKLEERQAYLFQEDSNPSLFADNSNNATAFKQKIKGMPQLSSLNSNDLENIIVSGVNENTVQNKKTGTFLHALCGFWFKNFLPEYVNSDLLLDGYKKAVTQSLYYRLKGVNFPNEEEKEQSKNLKSLRTGLADMQVDYGKYLQEQKLKGQVDDLHKWVNNEEGYGFNSKFTQNLRADFEKRRRQSPLSSSIPSWTEKVRKILSDWFSNNPKDEGEYRTDRYLEEAVMSAQVAAPYVELRRQEKDFHPVRKCLNNPSHFFGFEKISIAGRAGKNMKYLQGETTNIDVSEEFLINAQRDQGANQQFEYRLDTNIALQLIPLLTLGLFFIPGVGPFLGTAAGGMLSGKVALGLTYMMMTHLIATTTGIGYNYRGYEGTGKRKLLSIRVSENIRLISERTSIQIPLEDYRECLVIRPRFSAFQSKRAKNYAHIWSSDNRIINTIYKQAGMLLCTEGKERKQISEDYYYIYPNYPINGITMDPSNQRNKPFTVSLRGQKAYKQFVHNLSCYVSENTSYEKNNENCRDTKGQYEYILTKNIEFADNLRQGFYTPKLFHLTGDTPGVYSKYIPTPDRKITKKGLYKYFQKFNDASFMDADLEQMLKKDSEKN